MKSSEISLSQANPKSDSVVLLKLVFCSLLGVLFFLTPVKFDGNWTILLSIISNFIIDMIGKNMAYFTLPIFIFGSLVSLVYFLVPRKINRKLPYAKYLTASHWSWVLLSTIGGVVPLMLLFGIGPEWVIGKDTGVTAYIDVAGAIFCFIGLGCLFLPFLSDYGLLDFIGTLMRRPFKAIFNLPGRSTIDVLASWVGSTSIGVILTSLQYEKGYYSARESATLVTSFSVVSLPFVILTCQVAGLPEYFFQVYGSMAFVCILCAIIVPKLPPLSRIPDEYLPSAGKQLFEVAEEGHSTISWAKHRALEVVKASPSPMQSLQHGFAKMLDIFIMMMPAAMTIEFIALSVYYYTPIFQTITYPLIPVLEFLNIPEATKAAPGLVIGLLDQFVPAIVAGEIESKVTRFVLTGLSVTQLIFFAETALLIMRSKIPISVPQLVAIFCIRTIIALPILAGIAHWIF
ncbi:MAG: YjiH family protein [Cellvibrionaceae bacterium]|nr:YjiH family protein [Cellvibrionaceae bacterium]